MRQVKQNHSVVFVGLLLMATTGCAWLEAFRRTEEQRAEARAETRGESRGDLSPVFVTTLTVGQIGGLTLAALFTMLWLFIRERYKASALNRVMGAVEMHRADGSAEDVVDSLRQFDDETERVIGSVARRFRSTRHGSKETEKSHHAH